MKRHARPTPSVWLDLGVLVAVFGLAALFAGGALALAELLRLVWGDP